jgi:hypothetical protein
MSGRSHTRAAISRPRRRACSLPLAGALILAVLALTGALSSAGPNASAQPSVGSAEATTPQADASVPARQVTMIGATPSEPGAPGPDETWAVGLSGDGQPLLVRYFRTGGAAGTWTLGPALPAGFKLAGSPLAGSMTPRGAGVLLGSEGHGTVLVRRPGAGFEATPAVPTEGEALGEGEEPLLKKEGEALYEPGRAPLLAALEEEGGSTGVLLAPVQTAQQTAAVERQVLHWDGHHWTSEPIAVPESSKDDFRVLALAADGPANAWLLAQLASNPSYPAGAVALFRRTQAAGKWSWKPVALEPGAGDEEAHPLPVPLQGGGTAPFTVAGRGAPPTVKAQLLTVTGQGVWIDGERADLHGSEPASATVFFRPGGAAGGSLVSSWCWEPGAAALCDHQLPEALPSGYERSFAWAGAAPFGDRVVTGLSEGVSLRLEGETFARVLALGGGHDAEEDPGSQFGAAFSSPTEGWLGQALLPVHLTTEPQASRLTPWPVPFRTPLLAIAPQPGAAVGSLASEALAVGLSGAVTRYKPGAGWLPESLFGPGEKVEKAQLRAVAWPTQGRAYAVGDYGQMWLWRGETGLWEKDPATPANFRANLVGVAFDPANSSRGYAVGTSEVGVGGMLLRYGKTWSQETALPAQAQGAVFTSIAFAGSEAMVAFRKQPNPSSHTFVGGLLVNGGSGWTVDESAGAVMGSGVPKSVAGLPDGGAAVLTEGAGDQVYERQSAGSPWQASPVPPPGDGSSLALFREGGALRAIIAGGGAGNLSLAPPPPPGFPPDLYGPIGSESVGPETAIVLRQTPSGWSDESHELDPIKQPEGGYGPYWDLPYRPDPIEAVLVDPGGGQGWAVGGSIGKKGEERSETSDVERYPADGVRPTGAGEAPVPVSAKAVTFAIGGHAECANPCASRSRAGVGPGVWLSSALALARKIGVQAFFYTGPSVTEGKIGGIERTLPLPFGREFETSAAILGASGVHAYVAASPRDRDARPEREGSEASFLSGLGAFLGPPGASKPECGGEECGAAYALSDGGVRVIVLDDSAEVGEAQLSWLERELSGAKEANAKAGEPAIVIGSADLDAQLAAGQVRAERVAAALERGQASAYFYDSPEENVAKPLRFGAEKVPTYGSGTLGYVQVTRELRGDFHGASGILLANVEPSVREAGTNRVRVTPQLIPVIGELALEAKDGTLLRRSEAALFDGLARRPRAGGVALNNLDESQVDPYVPIPSECVGPECATALLPEYEFSSSDPEIGDFVERNLESPDRHAVKQNAQHEPIHSAYSGLFCAYFPGTTTVTISAGGLSASLPVTVQAGSVRQPCGTKPQRNLPPLRTQTPVPTPVGPAPAGSGPAPAAALSPVPLLPPAPPAAPPAAVPGPPPPVSQLIPPALPLVAVPAFVPLPLPTPARPTPPSGTSAVTSPVEVAEHEEEEEEATEQASNLAVAYRAPEHEPVAPYILGVCVLAAFAGAAMRRPRRGRREVRVAPATVSSMHAQRRAARSPRDI